MASLRGSILCLYSGCYGGVLSLENLSIYCGVAAGQHPLSIFWLLRRSFIFREFVFILWRRCGAAFFVYILVTTEEFYLQRICLYSDVTAGQHPLSIFWLLRRSFIFREFDVAGGSILCLYSGNYGGVLPSENLPVFWLLRRFIFRDFAYILASLRGSNLCPYSGCYGGAPMIEEANFADILGIARERFKHVFLLRPKF